MLEDFQWKQEEEEVVWMLRKEFQVFVSHFLRIGLFGSLAPPLPSGLMAGK